MGASCVQLSLSPACCYIYIIPSCTALELCVTLEFGIASWSIAELHVDWLLGV